MNDMTDIIGNRYGRLLVLEKTTRRDCNKSIIWECQCDCGKITYVTTRNLRSGKTRSCGCIQREKVKQNNESSILDLTNQKIGKLLVTKKTQNRHNGHVVWECLCDCGNVCFVSSQYLRNEDTTSCGCIVSKGEQKIIDLLNQHNIKFEPQKTFDSCRFPDTNALARFDFYLTDYNILVEYDGQQHFYYQNGSGWNNEDKFKKTKMHDEFKNCWCKQNNIKLIRIPYTEYSNLTIDNILRNNITITEQNNL